jgi:hypothetical protein
MFHDHTYYWVSLVVAYLRLYRGFTRGVAISPTPRRGWPTIRRMSGNHSAGFQGGSAGEVDGARAARGRRTWN